MKKIFILIIMLVMLLCGCSYTTNENGACYTDNFVCVERNPNKSSCIFVDKNTKVMYWYYKVDGGVTAMWNADGTPMLWEGEVE